MIIIKLIFLRCENGNNGIIIFSLFQSDAPPFPTIQSTHSLVAKHVTPEKWAKLGGLKTKTSGFTLGQVIMNFALIIY